MTESVWKQRLEEAARRIWQVLWSAFLVVGSFAVSGYILTGPLSPRLPEILAFWWLIILVIVIVLAVTWTIAFSWPCRWVTWLYPAASHLSLGFSLFILSSFLMAVTSTPVWDLLDLIVIPAALALGVWWLRKRQDEIQREIATDKRQQDALQYYLDRMSDLLPERRTENAQRMMRWQTLVALRAVDGRRKGQVLSFLYEHDLITGDEPIVSLRYAELKNADLIVGHPHHWHGRGEWTCKTLSDYVMDVQGNERWQADLSNVNLDDADLFNASLILTNLEGAYLQNAHLREAQLINADLRGADLRGADLRNAILCGADLRGAALDGVNLVNTRFDNDTEWPNDYTEVDAKAAGAVRVERAEECYDFFE